MVEEAQEMNKILITGVMGQLGTALSPLLAAEYELSGFDLDLDVADIDRVIQKFREIKPDIVVHAAAITNVDYCETHPEDNYRVNAFGAENVAIASLDARAVMLYVSTDYVFDGTKKSPYLEFDATNPINHYGRAKLAGENAVKNLLSRHFIVRTSWLYGKGGKNFPGAILSKARETGTLKVVNDQFGAPTYADDLAHCIKALIETDYFGTYHTTNAGICTWYDFAVELVKQSGMKDVKVEPISSEEYPSPAQRPIYSVLENFCLKNRNIYEFRHYLEGIKDFFR